MRFVKSSLSPEASASSRLLPRCCSSSKAESSKAGSNQQTSNSKEQTATANSNSNSADSTQHATRIAHGRRTTDD
jgi:hypothetical protein